MAEALELSSANRIRQLAGMPVEPEPLPKPEEPPAWSEIKASEDYKTLTYPEQVGVRKLSYTHLPCPIMRQSRMLRLTIM